MKLFIVFCLFFSIPSYGQVLALDTGATLPLLKFSKVVKGNKVVTADFRDQKGKALLLDFWATNCGSCIAKMPEMAKLQQAYKDKLAIFLVTTQSVQEVQAFLQRRPFLKNLDLPIITEDSVLYSLFPTRSLPQVVWVDANKKVKAITTAKEVSLPAVGALLSHQLPALPTKRDNLEFDRGKAFSILEFGKEGLLSYSTLTNQIPGIPTGVDFGNYNDKLWFHFRNMSVLTLLFSSYRYRIKDFPVINTYRNLKKFFILDVDDTTRRNAIESRLLALICYERVGAFENTELGRTELLKKVQGEIEQQYELTSAIEIRKTKAYALDVMPSGLVPSVDTLTEIFRPGGSTSVFRNQPISVIQAALAGVFGKNSPYRFSPETALKGNVTIELKNMYTSLDEINAELMAVGLSLNLKDTELEYLVIRERK